MSRINLPDGDLPEAARVFGLHKELGTAMAQLAGAVYGDIPISMREREVIRMKVAQINQCQLCLGTRFPELAEQGVNEALYDAVSEYHDSSELSLREKLAIEYTERFLSDHLNIDDSFFSQLKENFSDQEIFVISGIVGGLMMNGRLLQVLGIDQSCNIDINSKFQG